MVSISFLSILVMKSLNGTSKKKRDNNYKIIMQWKQVSDVDLIYPNKFSGIY